MNPEPNHPPLPKELWVLAWASLGGQVVQLAGGLRTDDPTSLMISMVLSAVLVAYVSVGVIRARTIRVVLAVVVLTLAGLFGVVALVFSPGAEEFLTTVLGLATTVVSLVALARYVQTPWFAWQRTRPPAREGASILGLVAIAVLVGVMGGLIGAPTGDGFDVRVGVEGR